MEALVQAMRAGAIDAQPAVVISNVPGAPGIDRASTWNIPTAVVDHRRHRPRAEHERLVLEILQQHEIAVGRTP